jgi:hypothetical protein
MEYPAVVLPRAMVAQDTEGAGKDPGSHGQQGHR